MNFEEKAGGNSDKVGGLPTHLPASFPKSEVTGNELGFLIQLYCQPERLEIADTICLQIYQSVDINTGDDPMPVVVKVAKDAKQNDGRGTIHPDIQEHLITWEEATEPDILPYDLEMNAADLKMLGSKLKGGIPEEYADRTDITYLGWITEYPVEFNFSGILVLLKDSDENVICEVI